MKYFFKGLVIFNSIALMQAAYTADTALSASSLKLKVYKMAVSTSPLCTGLITVLDNGNTPTEVDFLTNPSLGSGTLANGTYSCVVIEFSDVLKFTPSANSDSGHCSISTENTLDVCRSDNNSTSVLIDGTTTTCGVSGTADRVAMYLSTASSSSNGSDAFNPPTSIGDSSHGFNLGTALTISGTASGKFVVNPAGQVCDTAAASCGGGGGTTCELNPPTFSFSKL